MWTILEHNSIAKTCGKLPLQVVKKHEIWKDIVFRHGPEKLKEFPGLNDEKLRGEREGQHSSRLNIQYRVIYSVEDAVEAVRVLEITPHEY
jgi:plasmid maintenance system killer protein